MLLNLDQSEKGASIVITGEIDERGAEELKRRLSEIKLTKGVRVVFDFSGVTHIGSAGIGKLLLFYKNIVPHGGFIRIEKAAQPIFELFQQLKLDTILTVTR